MGMHCMYLFVKFLFADILLFLFGFVVVVVVFVVVVFFFFCFFFWKACRGSSCCVWDDGCRAGLSSEREKCSHRDVGASRLTDNAAIAERTYFYHWRPA